MSVQPRLIAVLDFDGTVTEKDIGDEICDRFAPPEWRDIDQAWVRNEISLPDAQERMWALARCSESEAMAYALEVGHLRGGLDAFLTAVRGRVWLASGGFDFYIRALLGARLSQFGQTFYNGSRFVDGRIEVSFPHSDLACERCAVCKGKVCDRARATGAQVIFIGDGASDRCAIGRADILCAVRGSLLARACDERGAAYVPFTNLDELVPTVTRE